MRFLVVDESRGIYYTSRVTVEEEKNSRGGHSCIIDTLDETYLDLQGNWRKIEKKV